MKKEKSLKDKLNRFPRPISPVSGSSKARFICFFNHVRIYMYIVQYTMYNTCIYMFGVSLLDIGLLRAA